MKGLIIYYSYYGNTKQVAEDYQKLLEMKCELLSADKVTEADILDNDFIVIGSPTRAFNMVKPVKKVLKKFKTAFNNKFVLSFDTRADIVQVNSKFLTFMVKRFGYAAEKIDKILVKNGAKLIESYKWYFVKESEGPITDESFLEIKNDVAIINKKLKEIG